MDLADWLITSLVSEIFDPPVNPLLRFLEAVAWDMNSNPLLLKGRANQPITMAFGTNFLFVLIGEYLKDLILEFELKTNSFHHYEWHDTPESKLDIYAGYKPRTGQLIKPSYLKPKPMSYLGFAERLHWMLQTSPEYHVSHGHAETAMRLIQDVSVSLFGATAWKVGDSPQPWVGIPLWVQHPWTFYDVVPDFLHTTGYWEKIKPTAEERASRLSYFDGGASDSCTFFFHETVFHLLLTNGSP